MEVNDPNLWQALHNLIDIPLQTISMQRYYNCPGNFGYGLTD